MKAETLISHTLFFALTIILILAIIVAFGTIRRDSQSAIGSSELDHMCALLKGSINRIYVPTDYTPQTHSSMGKITLDLPERIADTNYRIRFAGTRISIDTSLSDLNATCDTGLDINFTGTSSGGTTQIEWISQGGSNPIYMSKIRYEK